MRPIPIKDEFVWENAKKIVMSGPDGDLTSDIRPVEVIVDISPELGVPVFTSVCALEGDDLEKLNNGGFVTVSFYGHMVPFEVNVYEQT